MKVKLSWSNLQLSLLVLEVSVLCLAVATLAEDSAEGEVGSGKEKPVLEKVKKEKVYAQLYKVLKGPRT